MGKERKINGFGLLGIIILAAVIASAAFGGGMYWRETKKQESFLQVGADAIKRAEELKQAIESRDEQIYRSPTSIDFDVDTSNWKTYRNEKYGFEVKYPALGIEQHISEEKRDFGDMYNLEFRDNRSFMTAYSFGVIQTPNLLSLVDLYNKNDCLKILLGRQLRVYEQGTVGKFFENDSDLPLPDAYFEKDCGPVYVVQDFLSPSRNYIVRVYYAGQDNNLDSFGYRTREQVRALTKQILSTFKFIK